MSPVSCTTMAGLAWPQNSIRVAAPDPVHSCTPCNCRGRYNRRGLYNCHGLHNCRSLSSCHLPCTMTLDMEPPSFMVDLMKRSDMVKLVREAESNRALRSRLDILVLICQLSAASERLRQPHRGRRSENAYWLMQRIKLKHVLRKAARRGSGLRKRTTSNMLQG
jgi:hypothetical protein